MRKYFFIPFFLLASFVVAAQPQPKTEPYTGKDYGEDATKTTTVSTDPSLNKTLTVEIKEKGGVVRVRTTYKKDLSNQVTIVNERFKPSGKTESKATDKFDSEGKWTYSECRSELLDEPIIFERTPEGELKEKGKKTGGLDADQVKKTEERINNIFKKIEAKDLPSPEPIKSACGEPGSRCQPKFFVFAAPSVLFGDYGQDKETFFGGHLSFNYNLSSHISVGIDASLHSKKFGTENLTRSFIMVDGQYVFGDVNNCDRKIIPVVHILVGFVSEKYGSSSGSALAAGAGGGLNLNVNNKLAVRLFQVDYILTRFNEESQHNFRTSTGLILKFGNQ